MIALINRSDFKADMSVNISEKRLKEHIENAQRFEVATLMGKEFFLDLLAKFKSRKDGFDSNPAYTPSDIEEAYHQLLNGTTDVDMFEGLKPVISYYAYARFVLANDLKINDGGNSFKMGDNSERASFNSVKNASIRAESDALGYWNEVKSYLDKNTATFTLWISNTGCGNAEKRRTGMPRISSVKSNY